MFDNNNSSSECSPLYSQASYGNVAKNKSQKSTSHETSLQSSLKKKTKKKTCQGKRVAFTSDLSDKEIDPECHDNPTRNSEKVCPALKNSHKYPAKKSSLVSKPKRIVGCVRFQDENSSISQNRKSLQQTTRRCLDPGVSQDEGSEGLQTSSRNSTPRKAQLAGRSICRQISESGQWSHYDAGVYSWASQDDDKDDTRAETSSLVEGVDTSEDLERTGYSSISDWWTSDPLSSQELDKLHSLDCEDSRRVQQSLSLAKTKSNSSRLQPSSSNGVKKGFTVEKVKVKCSGSGRESHHTPTAVTERAEPKSKSVCNGKVSPCCLATRPARREVGSLSSAAASLAKSDAILASKRKERDSKCRPAGPSLRTRYSRSMADSRSNDPLVKFVERQHTRKRTRSLSRHSSLRLPATSSQQTNIHGDFVQHKINISLKKLYDDKLKGNPTQCEEKISTKSNAIDLPKHSMRLDPNLKHLLVYNAFTSNTPKEESVPPKDQALEKTNTIKPGSSIHVDLSRSLSGSVSESSIGIQCDILSPDSALSCNPLSPSSQHARRVASMYPAEGEVEATHSQHWASSGVDLSLDSEFVSCVSIGVQCEGSLFTSLLTLAWEDSTTAQVDSLALDQSNVFESQMKGSQYDNFKALSLLKSPLTNGLKTEHISRTLENCVLDPGNTSLQNTESLLEQVSRKLFQTNRTNGDQSLKQREIEMMPNSAEMFKTADDNSPQKRLITKSEGKKSQDGALLELGRKSNTDHSEKNPDKNTTQPYKMRADSRENNLQYESTIQDLVHREEALSAQHSTLKDKVKANKRLQSNQQETELEQPQLAQQHGYTEQLLSAQRTMPAEQQLLSGQRTIPAEQLLSGQRTIPAEQLLSAQTTIPAEQLLSAQRTIPAEHLLSGQRTIPAEQLLLGQRTIPVEQLLSGQRTIPSESLLSGQRTIPAEQLISAQRTIPAEQLLSGQRTIPAEQLISAQRTIPAEQLLSGQRTIPAEQLLSGQRTIPAEQLLSGQRTIPADQLLSGQRTIPAEQLLSGQRTIPAEKLLSGQRTIPAEQLISSQRTIPGEQLQSGQRTIPAEQLLLGQRTIPAEQLLSGQRTIPSEQLLSGQRTIPAEQLLSSQRTIPAEQLLSSQRTIPAEQLISAQRTIPAELMLSAQRTIPGEQLQSGQRTIPAEQVLSGQRTILAEQLLSGQRTIPAEQLISAQRTIPEEHLLSGQRMIPAEQLISAQRTIPEEHLLSGQRTIPAEQLISAQRTIPEEYLLSGQRTIPLEQLLSSQKHLPTEQLISSQKQLPTQQHSIRPENAQIDKDPSVLSESQTTYSGLSAEERTPGRSTVGDTLSKKQKINSNVYFNATDSRDSKSLRQENEATNSQTKSLRQENEATNSQTKSLRQENEATNSQTKSLRQENEATNSQNKSLRQENEATNSQTKSLRQENEATNSQTKSLRQENEATNSQIKSLRQENEATNSQTKSLRQENQATNLLTKLLPLENEATNWQLYGGENNLSSEAFHQVANATHDLGKEMRFSDLAIERNGVGSSPGQAVQLTAQPFSVSPDQRNLTLVDLPQEQAKLKQANLTYRWSQSKQSDLTHATSKSKQTPMQQEPSMQKTMYQEQSFQKLMQQEPSMQKPMQQEPSGQKPMQKGSSMQKPMQQEPSMQKPMQQEPSMQKPMQQEPSMQKPMQREPSMQKPMQQEPSLQKPMLSEQSLPQQKYIPPEQSPTNQNDVSPEQLKSTHFLPKGQAQSKQILTPAEQSQLKEQFLKSEQLVSKQNRKLSKLELSESNQKILPSEQIQLKQSEQVQLKKSEQFVHQQNVLPIYQTLPQQQLPESKQQNLQADLNSKSQFIPSEQLQSKQQFITSEQLQSKQQFIPPEQLQSKQQFISSELLQSKQQFITSEQLQSKQQFIPTERRQVNREEQLHSKKQFIPSEQLQSSKQQFIPSEQLQSSKQQFIPSEQLRSSKQQFIPSEQLQSSKQQFIPSEQLQSSKQQFIPSEQLQSKQQFIPSEQLQSKQQFIPSEKSPSKQQFIPTEQLQSKQQVIPPEKLQSKQQLIPPDQRQFNREEQLQSKQKFIPSEKLQSKQQFIPTEQLQSKLQFIPPEKLVSKHQFNPTEQLYLNQQLSPEMAQLNHQNVRSDQSQRIISSEQIQSNQKHLIPSELHSSESAQSTKAQNQPRLAHQLIEAQNQPRLAHQLIEEQNQPRLAHQLTDEQNQPRLAHQLTEESSLKVRTQFNVGKPNSSMKVSLKPSFNPTALSNTSRVEELRTLPSKDNIHLDNERTSRDLEKNVRSHSKTPDDTNKPSVFSNDTFEVNKAFPSLDSKAEAGKTIGGSVGSKDRLVSKKTSSTLDRTQASANVTRATANNIPIVQVTPTDDQITEGNKSIATDNKVPLNVSFNPMSKLEVTDIKEHNSSLLLSKGEKRARDPKYRIPPGAEEWYRNNRLLSMEIVLGPQPVFDLKPPASGHRKSLDSVKTNKLLTTNRDALTSNLKGKISLTKNNTTIVTNGKANKSFPKSTLPKEAIIESARNSIESDLPFNVFVDNKTKLTSDRVRNSTSSDKPIYREDNQKQDTPDKTKTAIYNIFGRRKSFNTPDVKKIPADDPKYSSVNVIPKNQPIERKPQKMRKNAASKYSEQTRSKSNMSPLLKILQNSSKPFLKSDEESDALFNQDMTNTLKTFRRKGKPGKDRSEDNIIDNLQESNKNALSNSPSTSSDNSRENRHYVSTYLSEKSENLDTSINTELSSKSGDHGQPIGASSYQNSGSEKAQTHLSGVIEEDKSKVIRGHHDGYNSLNSKNTVISLELPTTLNEMHSFTDEDAGFPNDSVSVKAKLDPYLNPGSLISPNTGTLGYEELLNVAFESSVDPEITPHPKIDAVKVQSATKNLFSTPVQDIIKIYGSSVDLDHLPENDIASAMDSLDHNKQLLPAVIAESEEKNEEDRSTIVIDSHLNEKHSSTVALETNQKGDSLSTNDVFDTRSSETSHKTIYLTDNIGAKLFMEIPQREELYSEMVDSKGDSIQETSSIESLEIAAALASSTDDIFPVQPETVEENRLTEQQRANQSFLKSRDNRGSWLKNNDDSGIGSLKSPIFKQDRQRESVRKRPKLAPQLPTFSSFIDKRKWGNSSLGQRKKKEPPKAKPRVVSECFYYSDLNMMQLTLKPVNWPNQSHESPGDLSTHAININFHTSPTKKPSSSLVYNRARSQSMKRSVNV
ncbi:hypothetical protein BgiBS90_031751 [Biomphalaria glabrata]|nr:hypothetical protein BgiBS90_031751 [Biomphalaria glabrata]